MGLNVAKGVLTAPAATGSQTISLASNFDPRAIILWATYETADTAGATGTNGDGMLAIGCATYDGGTVQQWFASTFDDDATASAAEQPGFNTTACLSQVTAVGSTVDFVCTLTSMSTGATSEVILNWTDVPASQILVHYLILGGSDLTAARAGSWTAATASATQNITVNTGWGQPDLLMFCTSGWDSLGYPTTNSPDGSMMMGWAKSATERRTAVWKSDTSAASMTLGSYQTARAAAMFNAGVTLDTEIELSAKASWPVDGFQISYPDTASFTFRIGYLALKGTFTATIGSTTAPTAAAPQTTNLALASGTPVGAMLWSTMIPTNAAVDTTHSDLGGFVLGATTGPMRASPRSRRTTTTPTASPDAPSTAAKRSSDGSPTPPAADLRSRARRIPRSAAATSCSPGATRTRSPGSTSTSCSGLLQCRLCRPIVRG
jgi:hypothetical protein